MPLKLSIWATLVAAVAVLAPARAGEDAPSVDAIVQKANHTAYYQGKDGSAKVSMTITDEQGRTRQREFVILRRDDANDKDEEQKFYVYFQQPADVNKMVFMVWKHIGQDDDRWLYLPSLDLVKRIAASDKRTSFVGSHFFYEDVSGRSIHDDAHELIETTRDYYVLKNTPKDPRSVEFAYYEACIHRGTFLPLHIWYFDAQGNKDRTYEALGVKQIQDYWTVTKARMTDLRTKGNTVIEYRDVKYDIDLPEDVFTERYLRRPPRKYLP